MGKFKDLYYRKLDSLVKEYGFSGLAGMGRRYEDLFNLSEKFQRKLNALPKSGDDPIKRADKQKVVDKYLRKARRILESYAEVPERRFGHEMPFRKELSLMVDHLLKENPKLSRKAVDRIKQIKEKGLVELGNIGSTGMKEFGSELTYAETMRARMKDKVLKDTLKKAEELVKEDKERSSMEKEDVRLPEPESSGGADTMPEKVRVSYVPIHIETEHRRQEAGRSALRENALKALEEEFGTMSFAPKPARK